MIMPLPIKTIALAAAVTFAATGANGASKVEDATSPDRVKLRHAAGE